MLPASSRLTKGRSEQATAATLERQRLEGQGPESGAELNFNPTGGTFGGLMNLGTGIARVGVGTSGRLWLS